MNRFASIFSWVFALGGAPQPASGDSVKLSYTAEQPQGGTPEIQRHLPTKVRVTRVPDEPVGVFNKGKECLEDKTQCAHSLENVCFIYLPSDKESRKSSKSKAT